MPQVQHMARLFGVRVCSLARESDAYVRLRRKACNPAGYCGYGRGGEMSQEWGRIERLSWQSVCYLAAVIVLIGMVMGGQW